MQWLLLFMTLLPSLAKGQRWRETVILTQQGPMTYTPTIQHSPQGYYTADVFPVEITKENQAPGRSVVWPSESNSFDVPVYSGVRVKPPAMTISKVMPYPAPLKKKKYYSKKNFDYIKQLQESPPKINKIAVPKPQPVYELPLDPRSNEKEVKGKYDYPVRGRRFVNRGFHLKQSEKILKGQAIDYTKNSENENDDSQLRYNEQNAETQTPIPPRAVHYIQNGNQGLAYGYVAYPQHNLNQEDGTSLYYANPMWF